MAINIWALLNQVGHREKAFAARQLAVMLDSGIALPEALRSLNEQTKNDTFRRALREVIIDLENGYRFSDALNKHPQIFNRVFVSVCAAGENSGKLDVALGLLASELERDSGFRRRVIGAFLYPGFILFALVVVGIIMVTRIIPALESVFRDANVELPWTTQTVIVVTNSLINFWWAYLLGIAVLVYFFVFYSRSSSGQRELNNIIFQIPVVNTLLINAEMARMTRILSVMLQSGVPIITALDSVSLVLDSVIYRQALKAVSHNVERGAPISETLLKFKEFPSTVTEMIAAGEKTGKLEQVLARLADFYEDETDQAIKNISSLLEPIVFVIVGLGVAFMVFSILVPIYQISANI